MSERLKSEELLIPRTLTLSEFLSIIKESIEYSFPDAYWVTAEITRVNYNQKGHCYLELVEKRDDTIEAQIKANIWANSYMSLIAKFQSVTNETLKSGMKVLLLVTVNFHEVYGLSLNVIDIDPTYSLGEMARKKQENIERLKKEGLLDRNKKLTIPLVPQRVAIVSSPTAAGYEDFTNHLNSNPYGYRFKCSLFQALMQGERAEQSITTALGEIESQSHLFDIAVIVRGGGSQVDLSCFDSYLLASKVATFPLPVITGIGHERDDTVVDMAANTRLKNPTAVAEFIILRVKDFEDKIVDMQKRLIRDMDTLFKEQRHKIEKDTLSLKNSYTEYIRSRKQFLNGAVVNLRYKTIQLLSDMQNRLSNLKHNFIGQLRQAIQIQDSRIIAAGQAVRFLDPLNILKRGYSITLLNRKVLKGIEGVMQGNIIETRLYDGFITSAVESTEKVTDEKR